MNPQDTHVFAIAHFLLHVRSKDGAVRQADGFTMENLITLRDGEFSVIFIGADHGDLVPAIKGRGPDYVFLH